MFARVCSLTLVLLGLALPQSAHALQAREAEAPPAPLPADYQPWPHEVQGSGVTYLIYQPQTERWTGDKVRFRAAVAYSAGGTTRYGIIFGDARTQVDATSGMVTLRDIVFDKANFPTAPDGGQADLRELQRVEAGPWRVPRERLENRDAADERVPVRNDPPKVFVSYSPALLVLIDGEPVLRPIADSKYERVINTRALILRDSSSGRFYLHVYDGWLQSQDALGPWRRVTGISSELEAVGERIAQIGQVDLLEGGEERPSLEGGTPVIYVSTRPAELIMIKGEPQFDPIPSTSLLWVRNTNAQVLLDTGSNDYFALISGRWFRAPNLNGPWRHAPPNTLPRELALIQNDHPLAPVRAAVPGTPQAQEAAIANGVPQTAAVKRSDARFEPTFDGAPQFRPVEGTRLQYVVNSPSAILRVEDGTLYAVDNGVWFTARAVSGPWTVATWIPPVIYTIPASSPLHYVTYVQVYGATSETVYTGYTPGYYGTVVNTDGTVVYGTGAYVTPWVGSVWYGAPWTYGFGWRAGVWPSYGFGIYWGSYWPTWGPWWGPWWRPWYGAWWRPAPFWGPWGWGWPAWNAFGWWGRPVVHGKFPGWVHPVPPPARPPVVGSPVPPAPSFRQRSSTPFPGFTQQVAPFTRPSSAALAGSAGGTVANVPGGRATIAGNAPPGANFRQMFRGVNSPSGNSPFPGFNQQVAPPSRSFAAPAGGMNAPAPAAAVGAASPRAPSAAVGSRAPGFPQTSRGFSPIGANPYPGYSMNIAPRSPSPGVGAAPPLGSTPVQPSFRSFSGAGPNVPGAGAAPRNFNFGGASQRPFVGLPQGGVSPMIAPRGVPGMGGAVGAPTMRRGFSGGGMPQPSGGVMMAPRGGPGMGGGGFPGGAGAAPSMRGGGAFPGAPGAAPSTRGGPFPGLRGNQR